MNARSQQADGAVGRQGRLARVTGVLYLILAIGGMFSVMTLESLFVPGDAAATAGKIAAARGLFGGSLVSWLVVVGTDVAIAVALYLILEPVSRALALLMAAFRLVYAAMLGAILLNLYEAFLLLDGGKQGLGLDVAQRETLALTSIAAFDTGFLLALIVFGVHLLGLGVLLYRSRYVPRILGILTVAAGVGYIADSLGTFFVPGHGGLVSAILIAPALLGELGLTGWFLVKGIAVRQETAIRPSFDARATPADASLAGIAAGEK